jgi:hypothetical protein
MKTLLLICTLLSSVVSQAGILVEPYLGYVDGKSEGTYTPAIAALIGQPGGSSKESGTMMGLRLGYKYMIAWGALDFATGSLKSKDDTSTDDLTPTQLGATFGVELPLIRGFVGYIFDNKAKFKQDTGDIDVSGTAIKVGAGLKMIPFVAINLEYVINDFKKAKSNGVESNFSDTYSSFTSNYMMLSASAPFNFF